MGHRERQLERFEQYNNELQFLLGISAITNRTPMIVTNRKAKNDGVHYPKKITVSPDALLNGTAFHELGHRVVVETGTPEFKQYPDRLGSTKKETVRRMALLEITDEGVAEFIAMEAHYRKKLFIEGKTELPLDYVYMAHINSRKVK